MYILVACKIVSDDQDARVTSERTLDFSKAHQIVSEYDLNALEAAVRLAEANPGSCVKVISAGPKSADDSKLKKTILAHGADELFLVADDALADADSHVTALELAGLTRTAGDYDIIVVGDGSADVYARQTGAQLASVLGIPYVSGIVEMAADSKTLRVRRVVGDKVEQLFVPCPCVVSIASSAAVPRIPGMKDILGAGKKPMNVSIASVGATPTVVTVEVKAPEEADRKRQIFEDINDFAAAVKAAL